MSRRLLVLVGLLLASRPAPHLRPRRRLHAAPTKLTVGLGYIPSVQFAQFYRAQRQGYYAAAGLDVTFQNQTDPNLITLVGQGAVDIGIGDGTSIIPAVGQGIPVLYGATIYAQFPSVVLTAGEQWHHHRRRPRRARAWAFPAATARAGSCSRRCSRRPA